MRTNIVFRHFDFDRVLESQVLDQVKCLEKQYHDLLTINVVIDKSCNDCKLCHIFLRGNQTFINVKRTCPNEFVAVSDAFDEVDRKLVQLERKHRNQIQRPGGFPENLLATTRKAWCED